MTEENYQITDNGIGRVVNELFSPLLRPENRIAAIKVLDNLLKRSTEIVLENIRANSGEDKCNDLVSFTLHHKKNLSGEDIDSEIWLLPPKPNHIERNIVYMISFSCPNKVIDQFYSETLRSGIFSYRLDFNNRQELVGITKHLRGN